MTPTPPHDAAEDELSWLARWGGSPRCPPPDLLLPAIEGTLPDPAGAAVRAHLEACALCRELADAMSEARLTPTLDESARMRARAFAPATRRARRIVFAAAAALALGIGAASIAWWSGSSAPRGVPASASRQPAAPPVPTYVLALTKPPTELPHEVTLRSATRSGYIEALERALVPFERGNYAIAARELDAVVRANPGRPHASFYLGVAKLLDGQPPAAAVADLQRARQEAERGSSLSSEITWYLAVALERSGQRAAAAEALAALCSGTGVRKQQACDGVRALNNK